MIKKLISEALYRKYRPENFDQVLGQKEVVSALKNSLENGKIAHAYLFSGGRGSGKTTLARIFAKELGVDKDDLYEIDAASNRGIEQIRELRDTVNILPSHGDYKLYIIDEVHMLTKEAFNALLKTLEEPPKHVVFILATTEKNKILDTIISRCQTFEFKKANLEVLKEMILNVAKQENIKIDSASLEMIARTGNGSFRDTLSELQKNISLYGDDLKIESGELSDGLLVSEFLDKIGQKEGLYKIYKKILASGSGLESFMEKVLDRMRKVLLIKNSLEMAEYFKNEFSEEEINLFRKNKVLNSLHLKKILEALDLAKKTDKSEVSFEIFLEEISEK